MGSGGDGRSCGSVDSRGFLFHDSVVRRVVGVSGEVPPVLTHSARGRTREASRSFAMIEWVANAAGCDDCVVGALTVG